MTLYEYSCYCEAQSEQAYYMAQAMDHFAWGFEKESWFALLLWAEQKHIADEINHNNDSMAFAKAIGMAHGIERAFR